MSKSEKFEYCLFLSDSEEDEEDDEDEPPVPAPVVAVVPVAPPAPPAPPSTPPPKAAGGKRKRDGLPTGIYKVHKQFKIQTRDVVTSEKTSCYFKTLEKAKAAYAAEQRSRPSTSGNWPRGRKRRSAPRTWRGGATIPSASARLRRRFTPPTKRSRR